MKTNFRKTATGRVIDLEARRGEELPETLDGLRSEVAALRASRERIVLAALADRRRIERDLHEGVQQHLVALAVNLQIAETLAGDDSAAAKALVQEMGRDVQQALHETAQLAQRIYPPQLEAGGLAAALRAAASSVGVRATLQVAEGARYSPDVAAAVYWCCLEALGRAGAGARATVTVRNEKGTVSFEVFEDGSHSDAGLDRLRDRVESLGGSLTIEPAPGGGARIAGSIPG